MKTTTKKAPVRAKKSAAAKDLAPEEVVAKARAAAYTGLSPRLAFAHFRGLAEKVPTEGLAVFTGRPMVMLANVNAALDTLDAAWPAVLREMRQPKLREVLELPSLVMALDHASGRVPTAKLSPKEIETLLAEASPLRAAMLSYLDVASSPVVSLVPPERVQAIREGSGKLDTAQDCVALAGVFDEFAEVLANRHPFTEAQLARVEALGTQLLQQMRPAGAVRESAARAPEAVLRDQFAALVVERYDHLQVMAGNAFGRAKADTMLPALRSAVRAVGEPSTPSNPSQPTG